MSESVTVFRSPCFDAQRKARRTSKLAISSCTSDVSCSCSGVKSANSKFSCLIMTQTRASALIVLGLSALVKILVWTKRWGSIIGY